MSAYRSPARPTAAPAPPRRPFLCWLGIHRLVRFDMWWSDGARVAKSYESEPMRNWYPRFFFSRIHCYRPASFTFECLLCAARWAYDCIPQGVRADDWWGLATTVPNDKVSR